MGIPSYFSYIVKRHPEIIKKFIENKFVVNNLYLDCNSIIYDSYHKLNAEEITESISDKIINCVISKIEEYLAIIQPNKNVIIAFDGVAPVAKLEQQRQRRYKSWYQSEISNQIFKNNNNKNDNNKNKDAWNTAAITPGTKFMADLNERVTKHFSEPSKYGTEKIYVSGSNKYGEGEHKIFEFIRLYPDKHLSEQNTIIYGLDADLIMLSINHLPVCPNIYLFRETPQFIQSINSELEPDQHYFLDIPELTKAITEYMNNDAEITNKNKIYDYIFLCFFLGNDFLPHFPALNIRTGGVDKMLNAYRATIGSNEFISDGKNIVWNNVRKIVKFLANLEEEFIITEHKSRDKKERQRLPETTPEDKFKRFESTPLYEREIEKFINPFKPYWQSRYYRSLFNIKTDSDGQQVKDICINFLEGLEWTMKYYTTSCPNWRWNYKYTYPPLLQDLLQYIPVFDTIFVATVEPKPVNELVQLCYVLPRSSLHLLPVKLYTELTRRYEHWYKVDCEYLWAYCRYFWESHVEMEEIDLNALEHFVEQYKKTVIK
jgi:5'-3' exonuclease